MARISCLRVPWKKGCAVNRSAWKMYSLEEGIVVTELFEGMSGF